MALDSQLTDARIGTVNSPVKDTAGYIPLTLTGNRKDNIWMKCRASFMPESYTETGAQPMNIILCDYASAGNGEERSVFQVWMPQLYNPREK